jgi:uncharacterized MnhB-related membrane protein
MLLLINFKSIMQKINKIKYLIVLVLYGLGSIILVFKGKLLPAVILFVLSISVYIILKRKMIQKK